MYNELIELLWQFALLFADNRAKNEEKKDESREIVLIENWLGKLFAE